MNRSNAPQRSWNGMQNLASFYEDPMQLGEQGSLASFSEDPMQLGKYMQEGASQDTPQVGKNFPPPERSSPLPRYDENNRRRSDGAKKMMGSSQSQGAQTTRSGPLSTRSGPLSPRTSYKPTSMLSRSQRYAR